MLAEYRISDRVPNRKFKVPRWVLAERLQIFWLVKAKLTMLVKLHFGYEPDCRNVDQSPFHRNEAGSKGCNTLALKGAPTVPLIENHAATRERWSLNSVTDSSAERIRRRLPGFEIMFKAEGKEVEAKTAGVRFLEGFAVPIYRGDGGKWVIHRGRHLKFLGEAFRIMGPWSSVGVLLFGRVRAWAYG